MRIAIGQLMEESNTFVRQQADLEHFRNNQLLLGEDVVTKLRVNDVIRRATVKEAAK